jgi:hypothetical protein
MVDRFNQIIAEENRLRIELSLRQQELQSCKNEIESTVKAGDASAVGVKALVSQRARFDLLTSNVRNLAEAHSAVVSSLRKEARELADVAAAKARVVEADCEGQIVGFLDSLGVKRQAAMEGIRAVVPLCEAVRASRRRADMFRSAAQVGSISDLIACCRRLLAGEADSAGTPPTS